MYNHVFNLVIYTIVYMYTCISYLVTVNLVYTCISAVTDIWIIRNLFSLLTFELSILIHISVQFTEWCFHQIFIVVKYSNNDNYKILVVKNKYCEPVLQCFYSILAPGTGFFWVHVCTVP